MPTPWTPRTAVATSWARPSGAATLWSVIDDVPAVLDGGDALTLLWLGLLDGGGATPTLPDIVSGAAQSRTAWATQAAP